MARVGADVGAYLDIGELQLRVSAVLTYRPDQSIGFASLAPTVILNIADIERSGLIDSPIMELGRPSETVHQVLVDGQSVAFDVVGDGTAVRLRGLGDADSDRKLTVRYHY